MRPARGWIDRCSHRSASEREPRCRDFSGPLIGRSRLIVSTTVVGMPSGKPLYGFQRSVPKQLRRPDIEHDLVVIPGIIKRRDIDLSPPVGEWPLFAHSGRPCVDVLRTQQTAILDAPGWGKRPLVGRRGRPGVRAVPKTPSSTLPTRGEETRRMDPCVDSRAEGSSGGLPVAKTQAAARVDPASATAPRHPASIS